LSGGASGSTVTLRWNPGVGVTSYVLEAGSAPGLSNIASVGVGTGTSFTANGVPSGTYYVQVAGFGSAFGTYSLVASINGPGSGSSSLLSAAGGGLSMDSEPASTTPASSGVSFVGMPQSTSIGSSSAAAKPVSQSATEAGQQKDLALLAWLRSDAYFKAQFQRDDEYGKLAKLLSQLQVHLLLWMSKFEMWIPGRPEHALVYMADEEAHGIAFPAGIDEVVASLLIRDS